MHSMKKLRRVKAMLVARGIRQRDIARLAGVKPVTVHVVLNGHGTSVNIQQVIADVLGRPYERLWGKRAA